MVALTQGSPQVLVSQCDLERKIVLHLQEPSHPPKKLERQIIHVYVNIPGVPDCISDELV